MDSRFCIFMLLSPGEHSVSWVSMTAELAAVVTPVVEDIFVYIAVAWLEVGSVLIFLGRSLGFLIMYLRTFFIGMLLDTALPPFLAASI